MGQILVFFKTSTTDTATDITSKTPEPMERETGIEPASLAWKARVLPLNYSRAALKIRASKPAAGDNLHSAIHNTKPILDRPASRFPLVQFRRLFSCRPKLIVELWWMGLDSNQRTR
jgi:hypothetical protein